jgi:acetyl esterase/lipase
MLSARTSTSDLQMHKTVLAIAICNCVTMFLTSAFGQTPSSLPLPEGTRAVRNVDYGGHRDAHQNLDLYIPQGSRAFPLIAWIHGGGWAYQDKEPCNALAFLNHGYVVASINYRLSNQAPWPAQLHDCKAAIRFLRAHAAEYHIDPDRIGVWGSSAGGHLVAMLGLTANVRELEGTVGGNLQCSSAVQAVCDWFGPSDLGKFEDPRAVDLVVKLVGGPVDQHQADIRSASPISYVAGQPAKNIPPFLIMHGDADKMVPIQHSELLEAALRQAGANVTYHVVPNRGHGYESLATPPNLAMVGDFFDQHLHPAGADPLAAKPATAPAAPRPDTPATIDFDRARELRQKQSRGQQLTPEEEAYLARAREAFQKGQVPRPQTPASRPANPQNTGDKKMQPKATMGFKPLCDMTADDRYKGEDGGLYGKGRNTPPAALQEAADHMLTGIRPLDAAGNPAPDGKIVLISMGMSNTTYEFSMFKRLADADPQKSPRVMIVDCAQSSQTAQDWAGGPPPAWIKDAKSPWVETQHRLEQAGVTAAQVQVVWVKTANRFPQGEFPETAGKLSADTAKALQTARERFPNLRIAFLSSRIYGGYASMPLNPEPYAYEGAFAMRRLILDQMAGKPDLNCDPSRGAAKVPLFLWGPYLWADGTFPRSDGLVWNRTDLAEGDGTHPSPTSGARKVADMLLHFFKTDHNAACWFVTGANP